MTLKPARRQGSLFLEPWERLAKWKASTFCLNFEPPTAEFYSKYCQTLKDYWKKSMCGIREETIAFTSCIAFQYNKLIQNREACVTDFTSDRNDHTGKKLSLWIEGHLLLEAWVICRQNILILLGEKENLSWAPICLLPWLPKSKIKFFCFQNHSKQTGSEQAWLYASCNLKSSISSFWFTSSDGAWQAWWIQSGWAISWDERI